MQFNTLTTKRMVMGCVFSALGFSTALLAQTTPVQQVPVLKGHQLYKALKIYDSQTGATETSPGHVGDRALDRLDYEFNMVKNPYTNQIPENIKSLEKEFSEGIQEGDNFKNQAQFKNGDYSYFKSRGPFNVGGRTRALAIDANDENIILAGGVSGGLWRSEDSGATWNQVSDIEGESQSITYIIQDTMSVDNKVWYYASGERLGNSAGLGTGAFYQGRGVYKSIDGGKRWNLLKASNDNDVRDFADLDLISKLAIQPTTGDLYVATFAGVWRSQDEGLSFTEVLDAGFDNLTEVAITPSGRIYATVDTSPQADGNPNPLGGFFTSLDGETWTDITPAGLTGFGRTIIEVDPNDENIVYFFAQNLAADAYLFKYNALAESLEEAYTDLTANIPRLGGVAGDLNLQGGYNMVCEVKPGDPNFIILGGTNLYRSTDGYTSPIGRDGWIAGYSPLADNFAQYANQHPDQHMLIYYPSDSNKVLTGNDGGVQVTLDITANVGGEPVSWIDLNQGYLTTQPYHVAFDPEANSDDLVAGFQDNGTWYTNSTNSDAFWVEDFGGDGAYSAISDGGLTRYVSSQRGNILRFNFDNEGNFVSFSRVSPASGSGYSFINPFILDKNNDNIMYLPIGNTIWRNNDLDGLPLNTGRTDVNWVTLSNTAVSSGNIVSLDVSKYPVANRLYYGTSTGLIYRMDNANLDDQPAVDISTGKGLPAGNVNDINVDPSNPDRVLITFSNYGIPSLFYTEDGGETWTDVSGNLEENPDGTGNGPSVRSTAFHGSDTGVLSPQTDITFAATSTGVYFTLKFEGTNTQWYREPFITNGTVADEIITRKDGFIAVAAHGNGLFSAKLPIIGLEFPESNLSVAYLLDDQTVPFEGSDPIEVDITGLFVQSKGLPIDIELTNSNPEFATVVQEENKLTITYKTGVVDQASIGLIARSGGEQVSEGFTINAVEFPIYEQNETTVSSYPSQFFTDFNALSQTADDFTIPEGFSWSIKSLLAFGATNNSPVLDNATIVIFKDENGLPGEVVYNSGEIVPVPAPGSSNIELAFPDEIKLDAGSYWLSVYATLAFAPNNTQWFWSTQLNSIGKSSLFRDPSNLFQTGATDWTPGEVAFQRPDPLDQKFQIFGTIEEGGTLSVDTPLVTINNSISVAPNPSNGIFTFSFNDLAKKNKDTSFEVYSLLGNLVFSQQDIKTTSDYTWDASGINTGLYLAKIGGKTFRILKK